MIYTVPAPTEPLDQGDVIDDCPLVEVIEFDAAEPNELQVRQAIARVVVVTQTCDLVAHKTRRVVVAPAYEAQALVEDHQLKPADIRGPVRAGRVYGWYFLPASPSIGMPESVVDLRQLHTVRIEVLLELCQRGGRRARIQPLYREHLAKHLADTYSRIGLPAPYETQP